MIRRQGIELLRQALDATEELAQEAAEGHWDGFATRLAERDRALRFGCARVRHSPDPAAMALLERIAAAHERTRSSARDARERISRELRLVRQSTAGARQYQSTSALLAREQ